MSDLCDLTDFTVNRIDKIATQYRESDNLVTLIETYIDPLVSFGTALCEIGDIDIDTAVGDQLTIIGKILGWPRINCNGPTEPVFGFDCGCDPSGLTIGGFCDSDWFSRDCPPRRNTYEFTDDDEYRRF